MTAHWSRLASLTGLAFTGLLVAAFVVSGSSPNADWSAERVVSWYTAHHDSQNATVYLLGYGALFALLFAATLRSYLRRRSNADGLIALGFGGGIVFVLALALAAGVTAAAVDVPGKIDPSAMQALNVLANDLFFVSLLVGLASFAFGNGIAIAHSGVLPKWLGWLGIVIGVAAVIPLVGWFAFLAAIVWVGIVSIVMFLRPDDAPALPAAADPAAL
jgi:hypothetical protein